MKDSEFLELLNLYLDHEISAADAARLEAEVQQDPARRRTYLEYCRMQKACTILAKDFADQPADKKIVAFEPRRSAWGPGIFAAGGVALAAACVTLILVNRSSTSSSATPVSAGESVAAAPVATAAAANAVIAKSAEMSAPIPAVASEKLPPSLIAHTVTVPTAHRSELKPIFVSTPLSQAAVNPDAAALLATTQQNAEAQLEWIKTLQLSPMQAATPETLRLDPRSPLQPANRTFTNASANQSTVERTAFEIRK